MKIRVKTARVNHISNLAHISLLHFLKKNLLPCFKVWIKNNINYYIILFHIFQQFYICCKADTTAGITLQFSGWSYK